MHVKISKTLVKPLGPSLALASYKANKHVGIFDFFACMFNKANNIHRRANEFLHACSNFRRRFYVPSDGNGSCFTTIGGLIVFRQKLIFRPTEAEVVSPPTTTGTPVCSKTVPNTASILCTHSPVHRRLHLVLP